MANEVEKRRYLIVAQVERRIYLELSEPELKSAELVHDRVLTYLLTNANHPKATMLMNVKIAEDDKADRAHWT